MGNQNAALIAAALGTFAACIPTIAHAQSAPAAERDTEVANGDIVVTARKRSESLQSTPISITAFTAQDLQQRSARDLADVAQAAPNVTFNRSSDATGSLNNAAVFIRGVGQSDILPTADPGIGIYVDGVYLGRSVGGVTNLLDVSQVEVLRGPQGTLFGRNTIGGAINITTLEPSNKLEGVARVELGSDNLASLSARINVPLSDTVAVSLAGNRRTRSPYAFSTSGAAFGNDHNVSLKGKVKWQPSDALRFVLSGDFYDQNQLSGPSAFIRYLGTVTPTGVLNIGGPPTLYNLFLAPQNGRPLVISDVASDPYMTTASATPNYSTQRVWGLSLTTSWTPGNNVTVKSITAYRHLNAAFGHDVDSTGASISAEQNVSRQTQFSQEVQVSGTTGRLRYAGGIFYFEERPRHLDSIFLTPGLFAVLHNVALDFSLTTSLALKTESIGGYGFATFDLGSGFSASAGLRLTRDSKDFTTSQIRRESNTVSLPETTRHAAWTNLSPKIGLEYHPSANALFYASFAQGFKSGTFNGRSASLSGVTSVDPETVDSFELGSKLTLLDRHLRLSGALFSNRYKNIQVQATLTDPTGAINVVLANAASAEVYGGEFEASARFGKLDLSTGVGYTYSRILQSTPTALAAGIEPGDRLRKTPRVTWNVSGQYTFRTPVADFIPRIDYSYRTSQYHAASNAPISFEPGYGLLNARLTVRSDDEKLSLALYGTNLGNKIYYYNISENAQSLGVPARRREWGVELGYKF